MRPCNTQVPEPFHKCDDNHQNVLKNLVSVSRTDILSVLIVLDATFGTLLTVRLHYPVQVKRMAKTLKDSVAVINIVGIAIVAEGNQITLTFNVRTMKNFE